MADQLWFVTVIFLRGIKFAVIAGNISCHL